MTHTLPLVRRVDFGYFVRPAQETGTGQPRVEVLLGYAVLHPDGVLVFDTGMGEGDPDAEALYRPVRRPLRGALRHASIDIDDIRWVANCHLHFDHCGNNPALVGRPIFVQSVELETARTTKDYTLPTVIDFAGADYRQVDGDVEIMPNVHLMPTPGHTRGHQSIAVRTADGTVILAGQATNTAFDYGSAQLAWRARQEGWVNAGITELPWIERLQALDPKRILFAHDHAVWEP